MENITIRKAIPTDAPCIALLARITFTETFNNHFNDPQDLQNYYNETFSVKKISNSIQNENNIFWIAFCDEIPVGYAKLKKHSKTTFINSNSVSQLQKIYVLKDFLSKKIGYKLQNEIFEETKLIKTKKLWLSVLKTNYRAINFYKKSDFTQIGTHTFDIGKAHFNFIVLKKDF